MNTYTLDEDSKNTLELFVERTEALKQFISENNFGGGLGGLFRDVDEREWQIHSAINGTFFYGKFVHVTAEKRKKYNQWKSEPGLFNELKKVFVDSLVFIIDQIMKVAEASKEELDLSTRNTEP